MSEPTVLEGVVQAIIFRNEDNGYTVLSLDGADGLVAVGVMPFLNVGERVRLHGIWRDHPDYGRQFQAERYELLAPDDTNAVLTVLSSGWIKGIGAKTAALLVAHFGADTLRIMRDEPDRVALIKGIGKKRADEIARQLKEKQSFEDLTLMLAPLGIGQSRIMRISKEYGPMAMQIVSANPYQLADDIPGIGFLTADRLAQKLGMDVRAPSRLRSVLTYVLQQALAAGHCWLPRQMLVQSALDLLRLQESDRQLLEEELDRHDRIQRFGRELDRSGTWEERCALKEVEQIERLTADRLRRRLDKPAGRLPGLADGAAAARLLDQRCRMLELEPAPEQREALLQALQMPLMILTGGPGTGKTTIIRLLCDCYAACGATIELAAPTGRAARRLAEATGREAATLHRLLELRPRDTDDTAFFMPAASLDCDVLIVDESSMIDIFLFSQLLYALPEDCRLILVGDADQLPSVGPGEVLRDLIRSGRIPVARLTQIFRQSSQSLIVRNAHRINQGESLELVQTRESSFLFIPRDDGESIAACVLGLVTRVLPDVYGLSADQDIQVLTPWHKGPAGTRALNIELQRLRQGEQKEAGLLAHGTWFRPGDKVMQTRNNYDLEWLLDTAEKREWGSGVFNGETGTVLLADRARHLLTVRLDDGRVAEYDRTALEDLDLAYAMTVHKSQGSEYAAVILAIPPGAPQMLTRNLLYTAITRARQRLFLIARRTTIAAMIANDQSRSRRTSLADYLSRRD